MGWNFRRLKERRIEMDFTDLETSLQMEKVKYTKEELRDGTQLTVPARDDVDIIITAYDRHAEEGLKYHIACFWDGGVEAVPVAIMSNVKMLARYVSSLIDDDTLDHWMD
ncbi:hypothetical protein FDA94_28885 [Herbidospora galbida]|uniref:Uncharacterized protein n=1 Tax=Herbidospora galbida TaxID=2575442 RepID=A0A4U3M6T4_9ACTN|nr:hypothetical protein [Herbidospora galbida]TKK84648.1 hypothetical protein FDA94_28885 [Herbidospora galbida]